MKGKRRWVGPRVWVADESGKMHYGTLWFTDETSVLIREDGRPGLVGFPRAAEGTRWGFADGAPTAADRPAGVAKAPKLKRVPMRRKLMRRRMHEWDRASLLPESLVAVLASVFPAPPSERVRLHLAAFDWWFQRRPDKFELMRLALLLHRLDLEQSDKAWITQAIRHANAFDDEVDAVLRA